jgi:hypothetical protein
LLAPALDRPATRERHDVLTKNLLRSRYRLLSAVTGAHDRNRTGDLVLTKDALYRLSYVGLNPSPVRDFHPPPSRSFAPITRPSRERLERVMGIEPTPSAWKAEVLPLNYTRLNQPAAPHLRSSRTTRTHPQDPCPAPPHQRPATGKSGGGGRIRTFEGISRQIYSLLPLAAWVPLRQMSRVFSGPSPGMSTVLNHQAPNKSARPPVGGRRTGLFVLDRDATRPAARVSPPFDARGAAPRGLLRHDSDRNGSPGALSPRPGGPKRSPDRRGAPRREARAAQADR